MVLELLCEVASAISLMAFSDNVKQKKRKTVTKCTLKKQRDEISQNEITVAFLLKVLI